MLAAFQADPTVFQLERKSVTPPLQNEGMNDAYIAQAIELLEKANADLEPELLSIPDARELLGVYARAQRLAAFGVAALARRIDEAPSVARVTGTSIGQAKETITTGKVLGDSAPLREALERGAVSLEQASEIARAEQSAPGVAPELVAVAGEESFHVLRERARAAKLAAEQHRDLGARQHAARSARSYTDELGLVHVHLALEPHVGTPIVNRAEAEAARLARKARATKSDQGAAKTRGKEKEGSPEPFERYLADAYAALLSGSGKGRSRRPELVVLVSYEITQRGWKDVRAGEVCKIPGVGPVAPQVARMIAKDAFLSGVFYDGKDLRHLVRYSRSIPIEVAIALELGPPPEFDGVRCTDCGNRFRTELDHVEPRAALGPTAHGNLNPRCYSCHRAKTERTARRAS